MTSLTAASPRSSWYNPGLTAGGAQGLVPTPEGPAINSQRGLILTRPQKPGSDLPPHADDSS